MILQMLGVFAEFEHATIVERTKVGMEKKAKGGAWVGGVVPYGYQLDPDQGLVADEDEALIVKKMFKMYALGKQGASVLPPSTVTQAARSSFPPGAVENRPGTTHVPALLKPVERPLAWVAADSAYDTEGVYAAIERHREGRSPRVLIPPTKNA